MSRDKKPDRPQAADPERRHSQTSQLSTLTPTSWEGTNRTNKDVMHPTGATVDRATSRVGSSLHVKGEISGNHDLYIEGTVEGLVQLDERKLTVGTTAEVTADSGVGQGISPFQCE